MWIMDSMWLGRGFCAFEGEEVRREPFSAFQAIIFAQCLNISRVWLTLNGVNLHRDCARRWLKSLVLFPEQFRETSRQSSERSEEHTSELQSRGHLVCRLLLEKKNQTTIYIIMLYVA